MILMLLGAHCYARGLHVEAITPLFDGAAPLFQTTSTNRSLGAPESTLQIHYPPVLLSPFFCAAIPE